MQNQENVSLIMTRVYCDILPAPTPTVPKGEAVLGTVALGLPCGTLGFGGSKINNLLCKYVLAGMGLHERLTQGVCLVCLT